jgi:hypothetical protein
MNIQLLSITLMIALVFANGCATTNTARTKIDMENSKAAYDRCLKQNPNDISRCEALKRAYEADLKAYQEECKSMPPSTTGFIEFGLGAPGIGLPSYK